MEIVQQYGPRRQVRWGDVVIERERPVWFEVSADVWDQLRVAARFAGWRQMCAP